MAITALNTISGEIQSQPLNDNFSHIATEVNAHLVDNAAYPEQFGAVAGTTADNTTAVQATIDYCIANGKDMHLSRFYKITSQLTMSSPIKIFGVGTTLSGFLTTVNDGSPTLYLNCSQWHLEDFSITSTTLRNTTGIKTKANSTRWFMKNVLSEQCAVGMDINGWIGQCINIYTNYNTLGFKGTQLNGCSLYLVAETNEVGFQLLDCIGTKLSGVVEGNTSHGGDVDNCIGVTYDLYMENNTGYHIKTGYVTECKNISVIGNAYFVGSSHTTGNLMFDKVKGLDFLGGYYSSDKSIISTTINTTGINLSSTLPINTSMIDDSKNLQKRYNYFPNANMNAYLRGYPVVKKFNVNISEETTNTLSGGSALRITCTAGGTSDNYVRIYFPSSVINYFKGKKCTVGCWVYFPDHADFDGTSGNFPNICIQDSAGLTSNTVNNVTKGHWQFICVTRDILIGNAALYVLLKVTNSATPTINQYAIFTDFIMSDVEYLTYDTIRNNIPAPIVGKFVDGVWKDFGTAIPDDQGADDISVWEIGDYRTNTNPVEAGTAGSKYIIKGWVRITNGRSHVLNTDWLQDRCLTGN